MSKDVHNGIIYVNRPDALDFVPVPTFYMLELARGFEELGCEIELGFVDSHGNNALFLDVLKSNPPDFCFGTAFTGWQLFEDDNWSYDRHGVTYCQSLESFWGYHKNLGWPCHNHIIFHADTSYRDFISGWMSCAASNNLCVNTALTMDSDGKKLRPVLPYKEYQRDIDVLFVGNVRDRMVEDVLTRFPQPIRDLAFHIAETSYGMVRTPLYRSCHQALVAHSVDLEVFSDIYFRFQYAVDLIARSKRRAKVLELLAPFNVHLVSNEETGHENFTHQKPCSWPDIQSLMDRSKIVVADIPNQPNLLNERVLNCLAQNTFVLAQANNAHLSTFEDGETIAMYDLQDDEMLPDLIRHYLERPIDRMRIAEAGGNVVRKNYTYRQAAEHYLNVIRSHTFPQAS